MAQVLVAGDLQSKAALDFPGYAEPINGYGVLTKYTQTEQPPPFDPSKNPNERIENPALIWPEPQTTILPTEQAEARCPPA